MKAFTYGNYIKCIHTLRLNAVLRLAEEGTQYHLNQSDRKNLHDKSIRSILKDTAEIEKFINQFIRPKEKIKAENLEDYSGKKFRGTEEKIVYKVKNREIFFLIEHQSRIDNRISYRMLNNCIDIMQEWTRNKETRKNTRISNYCSDYSLYRRSKMENVTKFSEKTN